jgi:hypothetical protein
VEGANGSHQLGTCCVSPNEESWAARRHTKPACLTALWLSQLKLIFGSIMVSKLGIIEQRQWWYRVPSAGHEFGFPEEQRELENAF